MKININNKQKLDEALDKVQSRCKMRTLGADNVKKIVDTIEVRIKVLNVASCNIRGAVFNYENGNQVPMSYFGTPMSTQFTVERGYKDWFVTNISRTYCNHNKNIIFVNEEKFKNLYKF